jgi:hypothetical protein
MNDGIINYEKELLKWLRLIWIEKKNIIRLFCWLWLKEWYLMRFLFNDEGCYG